MSLIKNKDNIVAGIVLYNPDLDRLQENIEHIVNQVNKVILYDNGSDNISDIEKLINEHIWDIALLKSDSNTGIAVALNMVCKWSFERGYQYIITLDQDSVCPEEIVDTLLKDMKPGVAVAAPNIIYRNNESFTKRKHKKDNVEWVITSGSFISLIAWNKIGGFDEKLFIDGVDRDFCQRAHYHGYQIVKDNGTELIHELGNLRCRKILWRTVFVTNHPPVRKYYMIRNSIYLDKKHSENKRFFYIAKNLFKTLIYENQKIIKIKYIYKGIIDGHKM